MHIRDHVVEAGNRELGGAQNNNNNNNNNNDNNHNNNHRIEKCDLRFFTISSLRRELSPTRTLKWPERNRVQITCKTSSAYHVQPAVCYLVLLSLSLGRLWNRSHLEVDWPLLSEGLHAFLYDGGRHKSLGLRHRGRLCTCTDKIV